MTAEFESTALILLIALVVVCIVQLVFAVILFLYIRRITDSLAAVKAGEALPGVPPAREIPGPAGSPGSEGAGVIPGGWGPSGQSRERPGGPLWSGTPVPRVPEPKVPEPPTRPGAAAMAAPVVAEILKDRRDIQGSAQSLSQKYQLTGYLIATLDGLVVVSLSPGASEEAARYSDLFRRKKKPDAPGVTFLGIRHRGEPMLAVLKADRPLGEDELAGIGEDSEKILNWWL